MKNLYNFEGILGIDTFGQHSQAKSWERGTSPLKEEWLNKMQHFFLMLLLSAIGKYKQGQSMSIVTFLKQ